MISASAYDSNSETPFVEFLKSLEAAEDPSTVITDFARRFPQHAQEFRELARLKGALNDGNERSIPPPPERLGEFRIIRLISFGGMGEIYEAYHERLDRRVALKIIRRGWSSSEARERFVREQQVLAHFHHTHIVPIHTGGEEGEIQYFTMPYINGASLNCVVSAVADLGKTSQYNKTPRLSEIVEQAVKQRDTNTSTYRSQPTLGYHNNSTKPSKEERPNLLPGLRLSREYFVSVATTMADLAEAVEYAHNAGVLHRDLKPSNVMVEPNGHSWVIDFGLAAACQHRGNGKLQSAEDGNVGVEKNLTQHGRGGGTLNYMSPERWQGMPANKLSDVFSLGAMLYELLTLRRAFDGNSPDEIEAKILSGTHPAAHKLVRPLTNDLAAIAEKAMHKQPGLRYQSAGDMANDLQRWLRIEPTIARPPWIPRRLLMWAQRKPALASALLVTIVALLGTVGTVLVSYQNRAVAAEYRVAAQVLKTREAIRETALQQLQYQMLSEHTVGWSEKSWAYVQDLAKEGATDDLKELAAASCLGADAQIAKEFKFGPSQMAYDSTGQKLLMFGSNNDSNDATSQNPRALVWDSVTDEVQYHPHAMHDAAGPIAYAVDGGPVQLAWQRKDSSSILLWSIEKQEVIRRLECPFSLSEPPLAWSIVPDGSHAAVLVRNEGTAQFVIWETDSAKIARPNSAASQIELSPEGSLIAVACEKGTIEIWSTTKLEKIATLSDNHTDILCFAWAKDRMRPLNGGELGWLLATGAGDGDITIWDIDRKSVRSRCIGSTYEVFKVAFSPDGMTLASAGRDAPILWNVATGSMLLKFHYANTMTSVAFSPNGESLAVGSCAAHGAPDLVRVYEIQEKRGQQVLRGLRARVTQVRISADNRIVAALTDNWQLAVWDLQLNRLLHVFQTPIGVYAQSAGLSIDADERRIAVVAGSEAKVWDIDSGNELKSVNLPPGFLDSLVFKDRVTLVSARQESIDPEFRPFGPNPHPDRTPRVCRVRNLLAAAPEKPQLEIPNFKRTAVSITVTPAGDRLLIQGFDEPGKIPEHRITKLFDLPSGKELWPMRVQTTSSSNGIGSLDPTGRIIAMMEEGSSSGGWNALVDLESGRRVRASDYSLIGLGPNASINVIVGDEPVPGASPVRTVVEGESDLQLVRIGLVKHSSERVQVSNDSRYVVFGCSDGSVTVTDLRNLQRKLATVGLGW